MRHLHLAALILSRHGMPGLQAVDTTTPCKAASSAYRVLWQWLAGPKRGCLAQLPFNELGPATGGASDHGVLSTPRLMNLNTWRARVPPPG